jgi:hypothetical protein
MAISDVNRGRVAVARVRMGVSTRHRRFKEREGAKNALSTSTNKPRATQKPTWQTRNPAAPRVASAHLAEPPCASRGAMAIARPRGWAARFLHHAHRLRDENAHQRAGHAVELLSGCRWRGRRGHNRSWRCCCGSTSLDEAIRRDGAIHISASLTRGWTTRYRYASGTNACTGSATRRTSGAGMAP